MVLISLLPNFKFNVLFVASKPNRLNISKIIPQNVNDQVYYTRAESKSFYPVAWGVWVRRGAYIGVFGCMHT